jgi:hypothetical protein
VPSTSYTEREKERERASKIPEKNMSYITELEKKYNPEMASFRENQEREQQTDLNSFRKGTKRVHNYGFFGDLSQKVLEDKMKKDRMIAEDVSSSRQDFIRRTNITSQQQTGERSNFYSNNFSANYRSSDLQTSEKKYGQDNQTPYQPRITGDSKERNTTTTITPRIPTLNREISTNSAEKMHFNISSNPRNSPGKIGSFADNKRPDLGESFDERYKRFQEQHERKYQVREREATAEKEKARFEERFNKVRNTTATY